MFFTKLFSITLLGYSETYSSTTCYYGNGAGYNGTVNYTVNNVSCRPWSENLFVNSLNYPTLIENYCRNPQGFGLKPWCYTSTDRKKWEYCSIKQCNAGNTLISLFLGIKPHTSWKVSEFGFFSGQYFLPLGLNTKISKINIRIQSEYKKIVLN